MLRCETGLLRNKPGGGRRMWGGASIGILQTSASLFPFYDLKLQNEAGESKRRLLAQSAAVPSFTCADASPTLRQSPVYGSVNATKQIKERRHTFNCTALWVFLKIRILKLHTHVCTGPRFTMHSSPIQQLVVKTRGQDGHEVSKCLILKRKRKNRTGAGKSRRTPPTEILSRPNINS